MDAEIRYFGATIQSAEFPPAFGQEGNLVPFYLNYETINPRYHLSNSFNFIAILSSRELFSGKNTQGGNVL